MRWLAWRNSEAFIEEEKLKLAFRIKLLSFTQLGELFPRSYCYWDSIQIADFGQFSRFEATLFYHKVQWRLYYETEHTIMKPACEGTPSKSHKVRKSYFYCIRWAQLKPLASFASLRSHFLVWNGLGEVRSRHWRANMQITFSNPIILLFFSPSLVPLCLSNSPVFCCSYVATMPLPGGVFRLTPSCSRATRVNRMLQPSRGEFEVKMGIRLA